MRVTTAVLAATVAAAAGLTITAGATGAATPGGAAHQVERAESGAAADQRTGFSHHYRGHHIMGWGVDEKACAYIDGVQLVLYPQGDDRYLSALQAYQEEQGVRAITRASVRALGEHDMAEPTDPVPHCPVLTD